MIKYSTTTLLHKVQDGEGLLQMRIRWKDGLLTYNLGYRVNIDKWDKDTHRCVRNTTHGKKKISAAEINRAISHYEEIVANAFELEAPQKRVPLNVIKGHIDLQLGKSIPDSYKTKLVKVALQKLEYDSHNKHLTEGTKTTYYTFFRQLQRWNVDAYIEDITKEKLEDFHRWMLENNYKETTIKGALFKMLSLVKWAGNNDYLIDKSCSKFTFRTIDMPKTIVWLNWEELLRVYEYNEQDRYTGTPLQRQHAKDACEIFLLECFTGLRYSDIIKLTCNDLHDDKIFVVTKKTNDPIIINLNDYSRAIIERRISNLKSGLLFPKKRMIATVIAHIRKICKEVGIDTNVTITFIKGGKRVSTCKPKYELLATHTGRRTFICNALDKGVAPVVVMQFTGHKRYESMKPYISISDKAKEDAMAVFNEK